MENRQLLVDSREGYEHSSDIQKEVDGQIRSLENKVHKIIFKRKMANLPGPGMYQ